MSSVIAVIIAAWLLLRTAQPTPGNSSLLSRMLQRTGQRLERIGFEMDLKREERQRAEIEEALASGKAVAIECPLVSQAEWMPQLERPITQFARSNKIEIIRLYTGARPEVWVWAKDAPRMRVFVESLHGTNR